MGGKARRSQGGAPVKNAAVSNQAIALLQQGVQLHQAGNLALAASTYQQVLERNLRVMDAAAISLCRDNGIPIAVFDLMTEGNVRRVVCGESIGSIVSGS